MAVTLLGVMDGNQSLKRVHTREGAATDNREFNGTYIVSEMSVNRFKHDVTVRRKELRATVSTSNFEIY
jgi:hypothetical protein